MSQFINCKQCGRGHMPKRRGGENSDAAFCSAKCKAAYHRERTSDSQHASKGGHTTHEEKERDSWGQCEFCAKSFPYNDFAARGGQRKAKFCSNKCRVASFRAAKKAAASGQPSGTAGGASGGASGQTYGGRSYEEMKREHAESKRRYDEERKRQEQNRQQGRQQDCRRHQPQGWADAYARAAHRRGCHD